ncbi:MAG: ABC transporter permease [Candidatus Poribacteria bacterium]
MPFLAGIVSVSSAYVLLIVAMLVADASFTSLPDMARVLANDNIRFSIVLSLVSCTVAAVLSVAVAVPIGYLMSRYRFPGKNLIDGVLDIPIVLPPLVIGLSLLILFQTRVGRGGEAAFVAVINVLHVNDILALIGVRPIRGITYELPSVVLAQFSVACAFAVRTMRVTFDQIDVRREQVALTLGCTRAQAFRRVVLPEARQGVVAAGTLAWARSMGEFGPILVFAGATRMKTEVLPTTVFLELSIGDIEAAVSVSLLMVTAAFLVLAVTRAFGLRQGLF